MAEAIVQLTTVRQARTRDIGRQLEDEQLAPRVQQSRREGERTLDEWHDFVCHLELARRAMRDARRNPSRSSEI
jgi:hypothetical protein